MIKIKGKGVFGAIARGYIQFYKRNEIVVDKIKVNNTELEMERYSQAKKAALNELDDLYKEMCGNVGTDDANIFCIHQMILQDSQFEKVVRECICDMGYNAEYAVARAAQSFSQRLVETGTDYVKERIADVKDVSDRIIRLLQNRDKQTIKSTDRCIVCADDLMPSETAGIEKNKVVAFCTQKGSINSHTAILSRTMNIPAIVGLGETLTEEYDGKYAVVDGYDGTLYIEPDKSTLRKIERKEEDEGRKKEILLRLRGRKSMTLDGREVKVLANIACLADVQNAIDNDAAGIGLFRSEFMYLSRNDYPDEEYLFYNYRRVLEDMSGKPVVIRTLDIGADKRADYLGLAREENPALGMRAIRVCLSREEMFKTQLRALLRASVYGNLHILIPMINDVREIIQVKELISQVETELSEKGIAFRKNIPLGSMIETPAAVITADILAKEVDFFSIGTNDLEQYTLAVDRQHPDFEKLVPENHLALLRMIKSVVDNAHARGIPVGICGELAGNTELTELFLDMNVDSLSVTAQNVLPVRKTIRSIDLSDRWRIHDNFKKRLRLWEN